VLKTLGFDRHARDGRVRHRHPGRDPILTRAQGAAPEQNLDTLELAIADLRNGGRFVEPNATS
jgi:hypothetical protein